jgi:hypothetical protein
MLEVLHALIATQVLDDWIEKEMIVLKREAKSLEEDEIETPPQKLKLLVNHLFLTRHLTSDATTAAADWARVTGDGAFLDPWDLAERGRLLAEKMDWDVALLDTDRGPAWVFGHGDQKVASLVMFGRDGSWEKFFHEQPIPQSLPLETWKKVLQARRLIVSKNRNPEEVDEFLSQIEQINTPTLARLKLMSNSSPSYELLLSWAEKWPFVPDFLEIAFREIRKRKDRKSFDDLWPLVVKTHAASLYLQGAFFAREQGQKKRALTRLENLLHHHPYHYEALTLLKAWSQ